MKADLPFLQLGAVRMRALYLGSRIWTPQPRALTLEGVTHGCRNSLELFVVAKVARICKGVARLVVESCGVTSPRVLTRLLLRFLFGLWLLLLSFLGFCPFSESSPPGFSMLLWATQQMNSSSEFFSACVSQGWYQLLAYNTQISLILLLQKVPYFNYWIVLAYLWCLSFALYLKGSPPN